MQKSLFSFLKLTVIAVAVLAGLMFNPHQPTVHAATVTPLGCTDSGANPVTSIDLTLTTGVPVGDVVVAYTARNAAVGTASVSDAGGNTYTQTVVDFTNVTILFTTTVGTALAASDTITFTPGNSTEVALCAVALSGVTVPASGVKNVDFFGSPNYTAGTINSGATGAVYVGGFLLVGSNNVPNSVPTPFTTVAPSTTTFNGNSSAWMQTGEQTATNTNTPISGTLPAPAAYSGVGAAFPLTAPEIAVSSSEGGAVADGGTDSVGNEPAGTPKVVTYTVNNTGTAPLNVTNITASNESNITGTVTLSTTTLTVPASGNQTFTATFTPTGAGAFSFDLDITSNDADENPYDITVSGTGTLPTASISANDAIANETPTDDGQFTVTLSANATADTTVNYTTGGLATNGSDYATLSGSVVISSGTNSATIDVDVTNDTIFEGNETVIVTLGTGTGYAVATAPSNSATVSINDNDSQPTVTFTSATASGAEGGANATVTAQLSNTSTQAITVPFTVNASSTATGGGTDYSITASPLTINAGSTTADITITINNDTVFEGNETVVIDMGTPTNATQGTTTTNTVTITDNDSQPTVTFTAAAVNPSEGAGTATVTAQLSNTSTQAVTVPFTVNASSTATGGGTDYSITASPLTINAGSTTADITLTINDDALIEGNETVVIDMGTPTNATQGATTTSTVTIADNEGTPTVTFTSAAIAPNENAGTATVTAQLSTISTLDVTVPFTVNASSTATDPADYSITASPLTINAGSTTADITVTIVDDTITEGNETVVIDMGTPTNATQGATTTSTVTITDNEGTPTVTFTVANVSASENGVTATVTAQLSNTSTQAVSVPFTVNASSTATGGGTDYSITASPLTINAGSTTSDITVTITDDALIEGNETVVINMGTPTNATQGAITTSTVTITDDEAAPAAAAAGPAEPAEFPDNPDPLIAEYQLPAVHQRQIFDDFVGANGNSYSNIGLGSGPVWDAYVGGRLKEAINVYGLQQWTGAGASLCLDGVGTVYFIADGNSPKFAVPLAGVTSGNQTCVILPGDGIVVLVQ